LRIKKRSFLGGDSYKCIGYSYLFLNELAAGSDQGFIARNLSVLLKKSSVNGIVVNVNIISRYIGEVNQLQLELTTNLVSFFPAFL